MNESAISPETVLRFWFGDDPEMSTSDSSFSKLWWLKSDATDRRIRERFEPAVESAVAGALRDWEPHATGRLALILLTDQFPRNIYRGTGKSFAFDELALAWCLSGIEEAMDEDVVPIQRLFWYLPLEHSESIEHQDKCVGLVERLAAQVQDADKATFKNFLSYAEQHREIIQKFGRFPHRNAILDRPSTAAEEAFLKTPGSSF